MIAWKNHVQPNWLLRASLLFCFLLRVCVSKRFSIIYTIWKCARCFPRALLSSWMVFPRYHEWIIWLKSEEWMKRWKGFSSPSKMWIYSIVSSLLFLVVVVAVTVLVHLGLVAIIFYYIILIILPIRCDNLRCFWCKTIQDGGVKSSDQLRMMITNHEQYTCVQSIVVVLFQLLFSSEHFVVLYIFLSLWLFLWSTFYYGSQNYSGAYTGRARSSSAI